MSRTLATLGLRTAHWAVLRRPAAYRKAFLESADDVPLLAAPLRRQLATARAILSRFQRQKGVLLADDVGLGKTCVAALVAGVFAGRAKKVRILAPNDTMARRWREEVHRQLGVMELLAERIPGLDRAYLDAAKRHIRSAPIKLHAGHIRVTTHIKGAKHAVDCDLLIVDEAHRARSEWSQFGAFLKKNRARFGRVLLLTATPFSLDVDELARALTLVEADSSAIKRAAAFGHCLRSLWSGEFKDPEAFGTELGAHGACAVRALRPWVIRHGVIHLPGERKHYGTEGEWPIDVPPACNRTMEIIVRTDRLLRLSLHAELPRPDGHKPERRDTRTNDPRFHQGWEHVRTVVEATSVDILEHSAGSAAMVSHRNAIAASLRSVGPHPKVAATVAAVQKVVERHEKVLVFCDHHATARELTIAMARGLAVPRSAPLSLTAWRTAWKDCLGPEWKDVERGRDRARRQFSAFLDWLTCGSLRQQVTSWLDGDITSAAQLTQMLRTRKPRGQRHGDSIAKEAGRLLTRLVEESPSTAAVLARVGSGRPADGSKQLPGFGGVRMPVASGADEPESGELARLFFPRQPDTLLAIFNSPFGPDVLVVTDRLSEGVDLHLWCRHVVQYELDPSPIRAIQRRGRIRRIGSWASRTGRPICEAFPCLKGTRDEHLVRIVRQRLDQFDLLLGGIAPAVSDEEDGQMTERQKTALAAARRRLQHVSLALARVT